MKKILLLLLISTSLNSFAQPNCFTVSSTGFSTASSGLSSISAPTDNIVWVSRPSGDPITNREISVSTDGGVTFTPKVCTLPPTTGNAVAISNVCGIDATTGYVACHGTGAGIWKTTNAGTTWVKQTTALYNDSAGDSFPNFVYFWDANNGVTMGDPAGGYFEIYTTTNGGTNWVRTPSSAIPAFLTPPAPETYREYGLTNQFTVTGNTIWLGTTFGRILKSTDKGLTWTFIETPVIAFSGGVGTPGPAGFNANMDWKNDMIGTITDSDFNYWRTTDGGVTWIQDFNGIPQNFDFAYVPGTASTVVCTGDDINDAGRYNSYSFDDGLTWERCAQSAGSFGGILEIRSSTVGWLSGFTTSSSVGGIWRMTGPQLPTSSFVSNKSVNISPNPATSNLSINGINISQVQITDMLGKVIFNNNYSSIGNLDVNIGSFNSGIYLVKVTNNDGISTTEKVIKQ